MWNFEFHPRIKIIISKDIKDIKINADEDTKFAKY